MKSTNSSENIINQIKSYGAPSPLLFNQESYELINYLDLVQRRNNTLLPDAVVEFQSQPLLYLVDSNHLSEPIQERETQLLRMKQILANRGDIAYICVLKPGQLDIYPVNLEMNLTGKLSVLQKHQDSPIFFQSLALGRLPIENQPHPDYVYNRIFELVKETSDHLISNPCNLPPDQVLSLMGRALFFRFLKDRNIILEQDIKDICLGAKRFDQCFADPEKAATTSAWLDNTFNGDLLPLPDNGTLKYYQKVGNQTSNKLFTYLSSIILGAKPAGKGYQLQLWQDFDFSHIPVGLLSQVYESFSQKWNPYSKSTSTYYTPRKIAGFLVDDAFYALKVPNKAKVLDPAAGAGIFLVLAFKRLVAETWKADKVRPDSNKIQEILYNQLAGFDINESALKLAALSLYLTAIELDPNPRPPYKLRFPKPLRDKVLFYWRQDSDPKDEPVIGSLGAHVDLEHDGKYDLVLSNPPWTKLSVRKYSYITDQYTQIIRAVARKKGLDHVAESYSNPDGNPDLPFVWKAMEWAKPNGIIALALPARILFKQSNTGQKAREALFKAIKVNGILNCSNLSDTNVWPGMNQPFCLFFAQNSIPDQNSQFSFVSPYFEYDLNSKARLRIDYQAAEPVEIKVVEKYPWLLKALSIGTCLDISVLKKINKVIEQNGIQIQTYCKDNGIINSTGYAVREKQIQEDASHMKDYPDLGSRSDFSFYLDTDRLSPFYVNRDQLKLDAPRDIQCYQPPLVLLRESMSEDRNEGRILLCLNKVVYKSSFYGYSGKGHKAGEEFVRYLYLISYSNLFIFYVLLTSPKFAAERRAFQKRDFDEFPIIPLENLKNKDRSQILPLSEQLAHSKIKPFDEIDKWISGIYGLDDSDIQVINDTVKVSLPFTNSRKLAESQPTEQQKKKFITYLQSQLSPFFKTVNQTISIKPIEINSSKFKKPWEFLKLTVSKNKKEPAVDWLNKVMDIANDKGASRIFIKQENCLILGLLNQYRYWTKTRARLCGLEILRNRMDSFPFPEELE